MSDPKLPPGTNFCKCAACGEYFNSVLPFDMHRMGEYPDRRCLSGPEMLKKGMAVNSKGYWVSKSRPDTAPRRPESTIPENP